MDEVEPQDPPALVGDEVVEQAEGPEEEVQPQDGDIAYGEMYGMPIMVIHGQEKIALYNHALRRYEANEQDLHHATLLKIMAEAISHISAAYTGDSDAKPQLLAGMEREAKARLTMIRRIRLDSESKERE